MPGFDPSRDPFDEIYRSAGDDLDRIPWANLAPRPELVRWLDSPLAPRPAPGRRALVIACGLGDDAEELAARGFDVVGFDFSPTAIGQCHRRFPRSRVTYAVQDLLTMPVEWGRAFDLVVEVNTVQSLVPEQHRPGMRAIAGTVADGGWLFLRCTARAEDEAAERRPWPLTRSELQTLVDAGLLERSFEEAPTTGGNRQFVVTYTRP